MLRLENIAITLSATPVVSDISLHLKAGQIGCLLGPSGCGKTSLLRAVAGFITPQSGRIELRGKSVCDQHGSVAAEHRKVGMVFQDFALFPHLTVAQNVAFGLSKSAHKSSRVKELLALVGLSGEGNKYPHQLSGGQQQRVAMIRALAPKPDILLLDEPFSSLDADLREQLATEIRDILKSENTTALMVTHDQHEAFAIADQIGVLHSGSLQQWGSPYQLYHQPVSRYVADFVGEGVFVAARQLDSGKLATPIGELNPPQDYSAAGQQELQVLLRPDDIVLDPAGAIPARVTNRAFRGAHIMYTLKLKQGETILCLAPSHQDFGIGSDVTVKADIPHVIAF